MDWSSIGAIVWLVALLALAAVGRRSASQRAVFVAVGLLPLTAWALLRGLPEREGEGPRPATVEQSRPGSGSAAPDRLERARPREERADSRAPGELELPSPEASAPEESIAEKRTQIRLFESAKVIPRYQGDVMLGVSIDRVRPGSFWELVGFRSGDVIFEANGQRIDNPEASIELMNSLSEAEMLRIWVRGADGRDRFLTYDVP